MLSFTDAAGNSTSQIIDRIADSTTLSPNDGFYLAPRSVALSNGSGDYYYTTDGSRPDTDSLFYDGGIYVYNNALPTWVRAASFSPGKMTFGESSSTYYIDSGWDDSFEFLPSNTEIQISWSSPFQAYAGDHFTGITLSFERVSNGNTSSAAFIPSDTELCSCSDGSGIFAAGEAYNISISAEEEAASGGAIVPSTAKHENYYYEDLYMRGGIILSTGAGADEQPLSVDAGGSASPWHYGTPSAASVLFSGTAPSGSIRKMKRSADGGTLYFIVFEDNPSTADQLWSYDFSAAPAILSASAGDVIDFTLNSAGNPVYIAAADLASAAYSIVTITPGAPPTENEEYSCSPSAAPALGAPIEIEMFDSSNLVIRFGTGELSAHSYAAGSSSTALTPLPLTGISDVKAAFGAGDSFLYAAEAADATDTGIFEISALSPLSTAPKGSINDTGLAFHDISAGGKNIIFSADSYSYYSGEHLFVYNATFHSVMEVMTLTGTSYEGLTGAAW